MKINENIKRFSIVTLVILGIIVLAVKAGPYCVKAFVYLFGLLSPFVFGYIIARMINPFADRLQKRLRFPRGLSVVLVILMTLVIIFGIIGLLGYKLFDEVRNLYHDWPQIFASLRSNWADFADSWSRMYIGMPDFIRTAVDDAIMGVYEQCMQLTRDIPVVDAAQVIAKSLPSGLIWTIMFILSMFFMVSQKEAVSRFVRKILGERGIQKVSEIKKQSKTYLGGYVKAQIKIMLVSFIVILVILSLFDAPFSLLIAALTALLDALPFFGSGIVLWPMAVVYFIGSNIKLGVVYIATYFVIMIMRRFIEPKLVSDKIGLNPLVTLVAMYIGYKFWGVIGLITGPLLLMLIIVLYKVGLFRKPVIILKQLVKFFMNELKLLARYLDEITK